MIQKKFIFHMALSFAILCASGCNKPQETRIVVYSTDVDTENNEGQPAPDPEKEPEPEKKDTARCTFKLGVHRTNLSHDKSTPELYMPLLDAIKGIGARTVRLSVNAGNESQAVKHIKYANSIGLDVTLVLPLATLPPDCYEKGTEQSKGKPEYKFWQTYPISKIDPDAYDNWISSFLMNCRNAGCVIDVLEVGNEVMWCAFNSDVPVDGGIIYDSSYKWEDFPESIREGIHKCGEAAVITKTACQKVFWEKTPEVVFGSINFLEDLNYYKNTGGCIVHPATVVQIATGKYPGMPAGSPDYFKELDGYAVHFYPEFAFNQDYQTMVDDGVKFLSWFMDGIMQYTDKPAHVTEIGFDYTAHGLADDGIRVYKFKAIFEAMDLTYDRYHWKQAHIYSWDQGPHALFVDGTLTKAGQYAISMYYSNLEGND